MGKYDAPALGERAQYLLKTLVERYISEGQPVGSRTLSRYSGLDLSPASIRNIMSDLEEMGFIASPHTSAGRVPTAKGYRFFVDSLLVIRPLESVEIHQLEDQLHPDNPSRLIASASHLLSDLTHFAGIVRAPQRGAAFRHLEFMSLSDKRVLLIIVTADGDVQNRILFTERAYAPAELAQATNFINQSFAGQTLEEIRARVQEDLKQLHRDMSGLMLAAIEAGTQALTETGDEVVVSGEHNLLKVHDLSSDMGKLRQLFAVFEEKSGLLQLLDASRSAHGVQIFIGGESGVAPLDECSVVTASYTVNGEVVGTIGVVGPTRMAYERVIPIVDITAKLLSSALSQP